ncbi:MAG: two-component sensor histidine kinase [Anaerolineaceae bacterium]|nr:two-component sensor histidine kinase [Anaerolineaceae bacterium]
MRSCRISKRPVSLTTRVMAFVAFTIGFSLLLIGSLVSTAVERHFEEQDTAELSTIAKVVGRALRNAEDDYSRMEEVLPQVLSEHHGSYFQVWDGENRLIYGSDEGELRGRINTLSPEFSDQVGRISLWQRDEKTYRGTIKLTQVGDRKYYIVTAIDMESHTQFLEGFHRSLWLIMALAGTATLFAAWVAIHQGHAPLRKLSETVREIQADRMHMRLDSETVPRELQNLVSSFNSMLGGLENSFLRLSNFSADIAHELRTPLTNILTQTQVVLGKPRSLDEYRELHFSNLEELELLGKMVNDMLWLAQSEHGLMKPVWEPLDIIKEVRELFDFFEVLAEEKHIQLLLEGQVLLLMGDRGMMRRAISNLLSNAIRHSPERESVKVRLDVSGEGQILLSVQNTGSEIPEKLLLRIFDRFYRVDPSRQRQSEGGGLGLAIVKSIVEAHGALINATSGQGLTCFKITFPPSSRCSKSEAP